jgi:hypothetical protein
VRIRFLGDLEELPQGLQSLIADATARTAANTGIHFNVCTNYGGRRELVRAARRLAEQAARGDLDPACLDEERFAAELHTAGEPDPDLLIRTSGEHQTGFRIPRAGHYCKEMNGQNPGWAAAHAWDSLRDSQTIAAEQGEGHFQLEPFKKWKVHLVKISERPGYNCCEVCGWRTMMPDNGVGAYKNQRTFWPTRLTTPEEREAWWLEMDALLNSLKRTADLSPEEKAAINAADAVRDEEVNGPMRRSRDAEIEKFMREHEQSQRITEAQAEKADMAARHAWWKAFDTEHAELKAAIKADKEAEGMPPEQAALFAISVSNDIMGAKQRDVLAAIPEGAVKVWPSGTALEIWATQKAKAKILAEVKLAFPTFSLEDQERRAEYAFKNPNYWAPWSQWVQTTTPEQRAKRRIQDQDWGMCYSHEH